MVKTRVFALAALCLVAGMGAISLIDAADKPHKKRVIDASVVLLGMQADFMEAVKEAFAYQLLNDAAEKRDFEKKMKDFDNLAEKLKEVAVTGKPVREEVAAGFFRLIKARKRLQASADNMFEVFEAKKKPDPVAVGLFEDDVDAMEIAFSSFLRMLIKEDVEFGIFSERQGGTALFIVLLHANILEAIQEAMAYPVLNDKAEKKDYLEKMAAIDTYIGAFQKTGILNRPGVEKRKEIFSTMLEKKNAMTAAALKMFADFEKTQKLSPEDVRVFEESIDAFTSVFDAMAKEFIHDIK